MTAVPLRKRLERSLARTLVALPAPLRRPLAGSAITLDGRRLDAQLQLALQLHRQAGALPWYRSTVAAARTALDLEAQIFAPPPAPDDGLHIEHWTLPGPAGTITARCYRPASVSAQAAAPALIFYHGGGFVLGSLESHDAPCRQLALRSQGVVVAIDYRLAPEHRFPAGLDDAIAAFRELAGTAAARGLDPRRLAVGGDSAGANLAAVVAQQTRHDPIRPCFQLLIYPTVDMTMSFPSIRRCGSGFFLERASIEWFRNHYLPAGHALDDPRASPLYGEFGDLPPAYVQTAGFDPLCDEGEAYAQALQDAGNRCERVRYDSLVHGWLNMTGCIRAADAALDDTCAALREAWKNVAATAR